MTSVKKVRRVSSIKKARTAGNKKAANLCNRTAKIIFAVQWDRIWKDKKQKMILLTIPLLVAVGEIGLDGWVGAPPMARQRLVYEAQLKLAAKHRLPVILHVRRSADLLLAGLRRVPVSGGIAHAFNGSVQQAQAFVERGFALGFGGTLTYERSRQIRSLLAGLPAHAWVLETDAPDIPPSWLYATAAQRAATGALSGRNAPHELPRIGGHAAELRGEALDDAAKQSCLNAFRALPGLARALDWRVSTRSRKMGRD
jgi:TatD DNase family protein